MSNKETRNEELDLRDKVELAYLNFNYSIDEFCEILYSLLIWN